MKNDILSERLNYLTTIAEEQSITRAAARLFISQPALTAWLNRLEDSLGAQLFDRVAKPLRLTNAGIYYLAELEKICGMQDRLNMNVRLFGSEAEPHLNIGIGRNRGGIWLPRVLPRLGLKYPDHQLVIDEDRDVNMYQKVISGALDIAIVESYTYHESLSYVQLPSEHYVFLTNRSSVLADGADLTHNDENHPLDIPAERIAEQLFICPSSKGNMNRQTQIMCSTYNFYPQKTMFLTNNITAYELCVNGFGVTFQNTVYPSFVRTSEPPLFIMPGGRPVDHHVYAIYQTSNHADPLREFLQLMNENMGMVINGSVTPLKYL